MTLYFILYQEGSDSKHIYYTCFLVGYDVQINKDYIFINTQDLI
jgi:hypothetical protein